MKTFEYKYSSSEVSESGEINGDCAVCIASQLLQSLISRGFTECVNISVVEK